VSNESDIGIDPWRYPGTNPIVGYTVGVELAQPLSPPTIRRVSGLHSQFKRELPRRAEQQAVTIQMGGFPQVPTPAHADLSGIVFDRLKPDGNTEAALSVVQATITYMRSEYSRWVEFWPVAERLLQTVGDVALTEASVCALLLVANNRFEWSGERDKVEPGRLLRKEPKHVAQHVLDCAGPSHSFHGYIVESDDPRGQRTDNIFYVVGFQPDGLTFLDLNFNIRLALAEPIAGSEALFRAPRSFLAKALLSLHNLNKKLLRDIILESAIAAIPGLPKTC
jgi:uncharacterized protein (TIGR04255 family)